MWVKPVDDDVNDSWARTEMKMGSNDAQSVW